MSTLAAVALGAFLVNLPFGWWRAGVRKFSLAWFIAVHGPVPLIAAMRILSGLGWHLANLPLLVAAYFAGQFGGGRLRMWLHPPRKPQG